MNLLVIILISILFSAFFSGMEIAFISSDRLRYALDKKSNNFLDYVLNVFYTHPRKFLSTLTVGNLIVLIVFVYCTINISENYIYLNITQNALLALFIQFFGASIILIITGELLPRIIFKNNPNMWVKTLAVPGFLFYVLLFPITRSFINIGKFLFFF